MTHDQRTARPCVSLLSGLLVLWFVSQVANAQAGAATAGNSRDLQPAVVWESSFESTAPEKIYRARMAVATVELHADRIQIDWQGGSLRIQLEPDGAAARLVPGDVAPAEIDQHFVDAPTNGRFGQPAYHAVSVIPSGCGSPLLIRATPFELQFVAETPDLLACALRVVSTTTDARTTMRPDGMLSIESSTISLRAGPGLQADRGAHHVWRLIDPPSHQLTITIDSRGAAQRAAAAPVLVASAANGDRYLAGVTRSENSQISFYLRRYDRDGVLRRSSSWQASRSERLAAIAIDPHRVATIATTTTDRLALHRIDPAAAPAVTTDSFELGTDVSIRTVLHDRDGRLWLAGHQFLGYVEGNSLTHCDVGAGDPTRALGSNLQIAMDSHGAVLVVGDDHGDLLFTRLHPGGCALSSQRRWRGTSTTHYAALSIGAGDRIYIAGSIDSDELPPIAEPGCHERLDGQTRGFVASFGRDGELLDWRCPGDPRSISIDRLAVSPETGRPALIGTKVKGSELRNWVGVLQETGDIQELRVPTQIDAQLESLAITPDGELLIGAAMAGRPPATASVGVALLDVGYAALDRLDPRSASTSSDGVCPGTINFDNSAFDGQWSNANNWDLNRVPNSSDDVCISGFAVTVSGTQSAGTLRVESGGSLSVTSGTFTIDGASEIGGPLTVSGGTMTGAGSIAITGLFSWSGGQLAGSGTTTANGGISITGSASKTLNRTLRNSSGNLATNNGSGNLTINAAGLFANATGATYEQQGNGGFSNGGTFDNDGTFLRTTSTGTVSVNAALNNDGFVDVQTGTLNLQQNGTHTGDFDFTGATLRLQSGSHNFSGSVDLTGTRLELAGATVGFDGRWEVANELSVSGGSTTINTAATVVKLCETLSATNGTLTLNSGESISVNSQTQSGGTVQGSDSWAISGLFSWSGGTLAGTGITTANGGINITGTASKTLSRTLRNTTGNLATNNSTGTFVINAAGLFANLAGATYEHQGDGVFNNGGVFDNDGTFLRTTSAGSVSVNVVLNNDGFVDIKTGTLNLQQNGTHTGDFDFTGATLRLQSGSHNFSGSVDLTGTRLELAGATVGFDGRWEIANELSVSGGSTTINAAATVVKLCETLSATNGTLTLNSGEPISVNTQTQSGGTVQGSDSWAISGLFSWSGGTLAGTGTTTANGGISITGSLSKTLNRTLRNSPGNLATNSGTGDFVINAASLFANLTGATYEHQGDGRFNNGGVFDNDGAFLRTTSAGSVSVNVVLNNDGFVDIQTGTLNLQQNGTHTGDFDFTGATLRLQSGNHNFSGSVDLTGTRLELAGATASFDGRWEIANELSVSAGSTTINAAANLVKLCETLSVTNGTLTLNSGESISVSTQTQSSGTVQGSDSWAISGLFSWSGGTLAGSGITTANGGINITGTASKALNRTLRNSSGNLATNSGTGDFVINTAGLFANLAGAMYEHQGDGRFNNGGTFNNAGTFRRNSSPGTVSMNVVVQNSGQFEILTGKVTLPQNFTQTAGATIVNGGVLEASQVMQVSGGTVGGHGVLDATLNLTGGAVAPGLSPGVLQLKDDAAAITRNFTQAAATALNIELGGLLPGSGAGFHDQFDVSGNANLQGSLNVTLSGGYQPTPGDQFTILKYATRTGTFSSVNFPRLPGCRYFALSYQSTAVLVATLEDLPAEVTGVRFDLNKSTFRWGPAIPRPDTVYDLVRGFTDELPVGSGGSQVCLGSVTVNQFSDPTVPPAGRAAWYLVRTRVDDCSAGTYGFATSGTERTTTSCP